MMPSVLTDEYGNLDLALNVSTGFTFPTTFLPNGDPCIYGDPGGSIGAIKGNVFLGNPLPTLWNPQTAGLSIMFWSAGAGTTSNTKQQAMGVKSFSAQQWLWCCLFSMYEPSTGANDCRFQYMHHDSVGNLRTIELGLSSPLSFGPALVTFELPTGTGASGGYRVRLTTISSESVYTFPSMTQNRRAAATDEQFEYQIPAGPGANDQTWTRMWAGKLAVVSGLTTPQQRAELATAMQAA